MSLSNPGKVTSSPVTRVYKWAGAEDKGVFKYFDKSKGDGGENVTANLPFSFIYLDSAARITGYNEKEKSNLYSGIFKKVTDPITVKWSKDKATLVSGSWSDENFKYKVKANGGKWTTVVFAMSTDGELVEIHMVGSSLTGWIEFTNKVKNPEQKPFIQCVSAKKMKTNKGDIYLEPVFESKEVTKPETMQKALDLDKSLQQFLNHVMSNEDNSPIADMPNDLKGNGDINETKRKPAAMSVVADPIGEDDELPF
jgi:hypothetical protein